MLFDFELYKVAIVTPPKISIEPIAIYHDSALKNIEVKRWIKSKQKILTKINRLHSSKDLLSRASPQ